MLLCVIVCVLVDAITLRTPILILFVVCYNPYRIERNHPILAAFCLQVLWRCRADAAHSYSHAHRRQQNLWYVLSSLVIKKKRFHGLIILSANRAPILFLSIRIHRAGGTIFATLLSRERGSRCKRDAADLGCANRSSVYTSFDRRIPKCDSRLPLHQWIQGTRIMKHDWRRQRLFCGSAP